MIAKIVVSAAVFSIDKPYSYQVPKNLEASAACGKRVTVPFGRGNRKTEGMILQLEQGEDETLKCVEQVLDAQSMLDAQMLRLAAFVRERYFCTFYDAIKAMLPAGLWYARQELYQAAELPDTIWQRLADAPVQSAVLQTVMELGGSASEAVLRRVFDAQSLSVALQELRRKKYLLCQTEFQQRSSGKTERMVSLAVSTEEAQTYAARKRKAAPIQAAVLEFLCGLPEVCAKELCYYTGATNATVTRMEKLGLLKVTAEEVFRRPEIREQEKAQPISLNAAQQSVYDGLLQQLSRAEPGSALLYGVTGSGKTAVYLKLIAHCLASGYGAILLVPEIALTPQLVSLFAAHFGDNVAVLHSSLRVGERFDEYKRIRDGQARLVIGTRSAVFAPVQRLKLLILDEEQEHSYKSENAPRYHAREVAQFRAHQCGALVLLGSATPSIESMYRARTGVYTLYTLTERFNQRALPPVQIADLKQDLRNGNTGSIGAELQAELAKCFQAGEQAILFLNRRGSSRLLMCPQCGHVPECPRCSVHLTYHSANHRLMCHYCGHSEPQPQRCPVCGGLLKRVGFGTQRVQEEIQSLFPGLETIRMDADTVTASNTHEAILSRFEKEKIPVLIGTQMVTKGLHFENVTLVGVLDADLSLYVDSFHAAESTFSMLTQVIGRAGRGALKGRAVIQTLTPENPVICLAAAQNYDAFYEKEIDLRSLRACPPFSDLLTVRFSGAEEKQVEAAAARFGLQLRQALRQELYRSIRMQILGPAPSAITRVNNVYRYQLCLHARADRTVRQLIAALLQSFAKEKENRGVSVFADLNAYD